MAEAKKNLYEEVVGPIKYKENNTFESAIGYAPTTLEDAIKRLVPRTTIQQPYLPKKNLYDEIVKKEDIEDYTDAEEYLYMFDADDFGTSWLDTKKVLSFEPPWTATASYLEPKKEVEYMFNEKKHILDALAHIDATYSTHYSGDTQPTELIIDSGNGAGFTIGNIIKYAARLGKKDGWNKKDVYKIIHYAVMLADIIEKNKQGS